MVDLEPFNSPEIVVKVKLWQDDNIVATPWPRMGYHDQAVDVAKGKQAKPDLGTDPVFLLRDGVEETVLHYVGNDVPVRDHDGFLPVCQRKSVFLRPRTSSQADPRCRWSSRGMPPDGHPVP